MSNFENNFAIETSTIVAIISDLIVRNIQMKDNYGMKGGCFEINHSTLQVYNSRFSGNIANFGGVMFTLSGSEVDVMKSVFELNMATDGSVLNSVVNTKPEAIKFTESVFRFNWAEAYMFNLKLTDAVVHNCTIGDNFSFQGTHGVVMFKANLTVSETEIYFTKSNYELLRNLRKLETGFFSLLVSSSLILKDNSRIHHMMG